MIKLEDLKPGMRVSGIVKGSVAEVVQVMPLSSVKRIANTSEFIPSVKVVYKYGANSYDDQIIFRKDEEKLHEAHAAFFFAEKAELARLAWQEKRMRSAHLFDPYHEVFASDIAVLPHQIEAVYGTMLGRQPLRFLLADDPGAGKTIMAGLYLREMLARASVRRCLIVAPASLIEQWRSEMMDKFRLRFEVFQRGMLESDPSLKQHNHLIAKMDQLKRKEYLAKLQESEWDLVICDEAHKMSASYSGGELNRTQRYRLAEMLSGISRHFLLMTATPHNGKEEDFQLFLRLLDLDRFEGSSRTGERKVDKWVRDTLIFWYQAELTFYEESARLHLLSRTLDKDSAIGSRLPSLSEIRREFKLLSLSPAEEKYLEDIKETSNSLFEAYSEYERYREGGINTPTSDLILRRMKEQLVTLDSKPLYPERKAYTANYKLSWQERELYEAVTTYCRDEFNRAERLEGGRKNTVGFAMTVLQRRLASSPEAIYQSLKSRRERLENRLFHRQAFETLRSGLFSEEEFEDLTAEERENLEKELSDAASAAINIVELEKEIEMLRVLEAEADEVRKSERDSKWEKLREIWEQHIPEMEKDGHRRKLIIFTEHRATLDYLVSKLRGRLEAEDSVVTIHGGIPQAVRREIQDVFCHDPKVQILVATDAAGEGINLQFAHLMVNYDLPWNPNRLEQRFGRIHRIGQTEVCHLWNIVTTETREGSVYEHLLQKLETIGNALNGKVFDILGELFEGKPLPQLLKQALLYGDDPKVRERLNKTVDDAVSHQRIRELTQERVLATDVIDVAKLNEDIQSAYADRIKPSDIRDFLVRAFKLASPDSSLIRELGGEFYEIAEVPADIDMHALIHDNADLSPSYRRVYFDPAISPGALEYDASELIDLEHPLLKATMSWLSSKYRKLDGIETAIPVFVDDNDDSEEYRILFYLEWKIRNAEPKDNTIERRARFLEIEDGGYATEVDASSALSYQAMQMRHNEKITAMLSQSSLQDQAADSYAEDYAAHNYVEPHLEEVRKRELRRRETEKCQVEERLKAEINYEKLLEMKYSWQEGEQEKAAAYQGLRAQAERRRKELENRLERRIRQIELQMQINSSGITIRRVAVIIPTAMLGH